jgi:amino acid adenylation domain-containing protein
MTEIDRRIANLAPEKRALLEKRLAESLAAKNRATPIEHNETADAVPSFGQEILWAIEQIERGAARYNISFSLHLKGKLDAGAVKSALRALVDRHETLRTQYITSAEGRLRLEVSAPREIPVPLTDLSGFEEKKREELLSAALRTEANRPIVLNREPVIRAVLYRLDDCEHVLQLTVHHVAMDGWSMGVLFRDFSVFYNAAATGTVAHLPDLPIAFSDFARWQREQMAGPDGERLISYWKNQLRNSSPALQLPTDRPRPAQQTFQGDVRRYSVTATHAAAIRDFCLREKVTPFMVALAALYAVLARYSGQSDILIGSPVAARPRVETEELVGFFTNTVILRGNLDGDPSFRELLRRVRQTALEAYSHQDLPLELLVHEIAVERDPSRSPLFQVMLVFQNAPVRGLELHGLETLVQDAPKDTSKFDLSIELTPSGEALDAAIEYNTDLFDSGSIDRLWGHLTGYLERALADPEQKAAAISLLTDAERRQLLVEWNATERPYPRETPLAELVEAQVNRTPGAIAVVFEDQRLTYAELNKRANQLARELRRHGAGPDQLVGLCVERSAAMIVALLAIVKAGAAYLPLDSLLPAGRLAFMMEDSGVRLVVTEQRVRGRLPAFAGVQILLDDPAWQANSSDNLDLSVGPEDLAYAMYTSGSTGKPKGVQIPRGALTNLLWSMREWLQLCEQDRLLAVTTVSFDIAGVDIWLPLLVGAQTVIATRESAMDGNALRSLLELHDITFLQATPVTWLLLFEAGWRGKPNLQAVCTGEAMPPELAAKLAPAVARLWNLYGPTETTIWSVGYHVADDREPIVIGRPVANTRCYILDQRQQPVPIGVPGELYIGGDGLARGYLNQPEMTEEKFVIDPFREGGARMYRTGDLARYRADGNIECLGRLDRQVKIHGYRIELGEIELALKELPEIEQAVVMARDDSFGGKRLVAFLVPKAAATLEASDVRRQLRQSLPNYMVPSAYRFLERLPISPNGKIDNEGLLALESSKPELPSANTFEAPHDPIQEELARIWADVLGVPQVGFHDDFFELGGDSLLAVGLILRIREAFPECQPSLSVVLQAPTVELFARTLRGGQADWPFLVKVREGNQRPPFFCVHGAGGNVLSMRDLALSLPPDLPFYCFQARGLDGKSRPFASVEETAECYVSEILKVRPRGPYYLGGVSYGGLVAFEMARRIRSMGESVSLLVLFDTRNFVYGSLISKPRLLYFNLSYFLRRASFHLKVLGRMKPREWKHYLSHRIALLVSMAGNVARTVAGKNAGLSPIDDPADETEILDGHEDWVEVLNRVGEASRLAARNFVPKPYDGHLLIFSAKTREDHPYRENTLGWVPVALGGVTACEVDGDHRSMMSNPAVNAIAAKLDEALRAAQRAAPASVPGESQTRISTGMKA